MCLDNLLDLISEVNYCDIASVAADTMLVVIIFQLSDKRNVITPVSLFLL